MRLTVTMTGLGAAALVAACGGTNAPPFASTISTSSAESTSSTSSGDPSTSSTPTSSARPTPSTPTSTARSVSSTSVSTVRSVSSTKQSNTPCSPSGTALKVSAQNTMFNVSCLAAPAGAAFTIDFKNQESPGGPPHNVSIYTADPAADSHAKSLYQGTLIDAGQSTVYSVPALSAGTFYFNCIVHPQMYGTFVVK